jgi:hypothetical protein
VAVSVFESASVQVLLISSCFGKYVFEHAKTLIESSKHSPRKTTNACFLGPGWKASVLFLANTQ